MFSVPFDMGLILITLVMLATGIALTHTRTRTCICTCTCRHTHKHIGTKYHIRLHEVILGKWLQPNPCLVSLSLVNISCFSSPHSLQFSASCQGKKRNKNYTSKPRHSRAECQVCDCTWVSSVRILASEVCNLWSKLSLSSSGNIFGAWQRDIH